MSTVPSLKNGLHSLSSSIPVENQPFAINTNTCHLSAHHGTFREVTPAPTVGIVTALACEYAAMSTLIDEPTRQLIAGDANDYDLGRLPSAIEGHPHEVVLTVLPQDGNKNASVI